MEKNLSKIIVIAGPNASGKSSLGIELAKKYNGEIISADSRQIFCGFDLCCGKVTAEERSIVPHHLLDVANVGDVFTVADYQREVYKAIENIISRGKLPIIVGGTGLYVSSVVYGYNFNNKELNEEYRMNLECKSITELQEMLPDALKTSLNNSDFNNKRRLIRTLEKIHDGDELSHQNIPRYDALQLGVAWPKEILHKRIDERLTTRIEQGMLDEVRTYLESGGDSIHLYNLGLEYRHIAKYILGEYKTLEEFSEEMARAIKKFAKRQVTWFKKDKNIHWIDMTNNPLEQASLLIDYFLK